LENFILDVFMMKDNLNSRTILNRGTFIPRTIWTWGWVPSNPIRLMLELFGKRNIFIKYFYFFSFILEILFIFDVVLLGFSSFSIWRELFFYSELIGFSSICFIYITRIVIPFWQMSIGWIKNKYFWCLFIFMEFLVFKSFDL